MIPDKILNVLTVLSEWFVTTSLVTAVIPPVIL